MGADAANMSTMQMDEGEPVPVSGKGVPPPGWLSMTDAVAHTGVPPMTLRRRVDAWLARDAARIQSGYAVVGARVFGGRLVDMVDAERVRLQRLVKLDSSVTAAAWTAMVRAGQLPAAVTSQPWLAEAVRRLRAGERPEVS